MESKDLMDIKEKIRELYDTILDLSQGLLVINTKVDEMIMAEEGIKPHPVVVTHSELPENSEPQVVRSRGRPRKEVEPELPPQLPPEMPVKAPEVPQKQSIVDRLLGKDASEKARLRAERMAQLEKELAELSQKK